MKLSDVTGDSGDAAPKKMKLSDVTAPEPEKPVLERVSEWADEPRSRVLPVRRGADGLEFATPQIIAEPIGIVARNMQDVGRSVNGEAVSPEQMKRDTAAMAGLMAGGAGPGKEVASRSARGVTDALRSDTARTVLRDLGETVGGALEEKGAALEKQAKDAAVKKAELAPAEARERVRAAVERGAKAEGTTAQEILDRVNEARKLGKPATLADYAGEDVKGMAGYVARQPGASREVSRQFLNARDAAAAQRLTEDVGKTLASGSVRQTAEALAKERSVTAAPLFEEAYRGGSMAPLERQFEKAFRESTQAESQAVKDLAVAHKELTRARAQQVTTPSPWSHMDPRHPMHESVQTAEMHVAEAESKLASARRETTSIRSKLKESQEDRTAGAPGAVWNPRIQRLLDLPIVRSGIQKGVRLERQNAAAEGRAFNASELAIKGFDAEGEPIVGSVPNMKLLASAKEGLDSILGTPAMRDPLTGRLTKEGVSVDKVRRALLAELDAANPAYKAARESWAGHSDSLEALRWGRDILRGKPEDIAAEVEKMSPSEKEFARLGVADMLREKILKTGLGGDEAKQVIKSPWMKEQLRPVFKDDATFNKFIDSVMAERTMFETRQKAIGGSQTAERMAEDQTQNLETLAHGFHGAAQAVGGNYLSAVRSLLALKRNMGLRQNPDLNEAIARLVFDPEITLEKLYQK